MHRVRIEMIFEHDFIKLPQAFVTYLKSDNTKSRITAKYIAWVIRGILFVVKCSVFETKLLYKLCQFKRLSFLWGLIYESSSGSSWSHDISTSLKTLESSDMLVGSGSESAHHIGCTGVLRGTIRFEWRLVRLRFNRAHHESWWTGVVNNDSRVG